MKCLLADISVVPNKDTKVDTAWVVLTKLGQYSASSGKIFHFNVKKDSKNPMIIQHPISKTENETLFKKMVETLPGSLVDVEFEATSRGTLTIKDIVVIKKSQYTSDELYK